MLRPQFLTSSPALSSLSRYPIFTRAILPSSSQRLFTTTRANLAGPVPPTATKPQSRTASPSHPIQVPTPKQTVSMSTTISAQAFLDLLKNRRSIYPLTKDLSAVSTDRIQEIVKEAVKETPSSFNSQSNRVLILFGAEHEKLWSITSDILKAIVPEDQWKHTADRIALFKGGAGTVLFFEHEPTIHEFQQKFALYADKFPIWSTQSAGILQSNVWTALEAEGLGANLQHYNPLIDQKVADTWGISSDWKLNAQLVFGGKGGDAGPKDQKPIEERVKVAGA